MTTQQPDPPAHLGCCPCGAAVHAESFRDRSSYLEFGITGNCQECQDRMFLATCADDPSKRYTLHRGAVVAHDTRRDEHCLLPFVCTAAPRLAWNAHRILRIGTRLQRLDPHAALAPMAHALSDHAVRIHAPAVPVRLACTELVIVLDHATHETLKRLPLPSRRVVVLAEAAQWVAHYGASAHELERAWGAEPEPHHSTLRTCALVGWALAHVPDDDANIAPPIDSILTACDDD